jgi:hypothetical protein
MQLSSTAGARSPAPRRPSVHARCSQTKRQGTSHIARLPALIAPVCRTETAQPYVDSGAADHALLRLRTPSPTAAPAWHSSRPRQPTGASGRRPPSAGSALSPRSSRRNPKNTRSPGRWPLTPRCAASCRFAGAWWEDGAPVPARPMQPARCAALTPRFQLRPPRLTLRVRQAGRVHLRALSSAAWTPPVLVRRAWSGTRRASTRRRGRRRAPPGAPRSPSATPRGARPSCPV